MIALGNRLTAIEDVVHRLLIRHSIAALRWSVGLVFLGFGLLKYFPGVSAAEVWRPRPRTSCSWD